MLFYLKREILPNVGSDSKIASTLPEREVEICQRFRQIRTDLKWSQPDFAKALGISRERLASYEYAKAPIKYWLARAAGDRFDINQRWLATGKLPKKYYIDLDYSIENDIPPKAWFSVVYDDYLAPYIQSKIAAVAEILNLDPEKFDTEFGKDALMTVDTIPAGTPARKIAEHFLSRKIGLELRMLPEHLLGVYFEQISNTSSSFIKEHLGDIEEALPVKEADEIPATVPREEKNMLTEPSTSVTIPTVKSPLQNLLTRINKVTQEPGKQTELAEFLGAPMASVSRWLSGKREPSGDTTLKMLQWVEQEERK